MAKGMANPYLYNKIDIEGRIIYFFETDQKVRYKAYFSDYGYMFGTHSFDCHFYSFDLVIEGDQVRPPKGTSSDYRIGDTVQECFIDMFKDPIGVVIAVYDSSDGSEHARKRKFDSWFAGADINYIERVDFEMPDEDYNLLSSVFLRVDLSIKEEVLDRYQQIMEAGNIPLD